MSQIFLLSGAVHSGKTTRLTQWIKDKDNVDGILQPVIDGKRYIKIISSGEIRLLEILDDSDNKNIITIGNYKFSSNMFTWARDQFILSFNKNPEWLIIDEFGKLEMANKGLEPAFSKIMYELKNYPRINLVIVVRDYLFPDFLQKYSLSKNDVNMIEV
jgi:nucleoside-triphosphatase